MEFVTTTSRHDQLKQALAAKKSEINWKPNNKTVVIVYRGEDESDSWQSECIEEVQSYLGKFTTCDVNVKKDFWEAVKTQLPNIRTCFGIDPPLVKPIDDSLVARIVCSSPDAKKYEDWFKAKLEEIYREESKRTNRRPRKTEWLTKNITDERLMLLKKINFAEKLQQDNKELVIRLDTEAKEIYFEGPQSQFIEAIAKLHKLETEMVEKKLNVSKDILEVLETDEGLHRVKCELEKSNVEAFFFVIDNEARIVGTSAAQADKATSLVSKLTVEEKVRVDGRSKPLLETWGWRQLCDELNTEEVIHVYRNTWGDTIVAGFREDVMEAMKELNTYLENNCIRTERFTCPSKLVRRYLSEFRKEDLYSIETQFVDFELDLCSIGTQVVDFEVKIQNGKGDGDFVISGNKEGLKLARRKLKALVAGIFSSKFDIKQPGLQKFFSSGKGDRLVKSVEKDHACAVHVQTSFDKKQQDMRTRDAEAAMEHDATSGDDDDEHGDCERGSNDDDNEGEGVEMEKEEEEAVPPKFDPSVFVTTNGQKISWRAGYIQTEKAEILISSQGACSEAIISAGGPALQQNFVNPNTGDVTVTAGFALACSHVIHTNCSNWQGGKGEIVLRNIVQKCLQRGEQLGGTSIAFPVIGTGNLHFPPNDASRIMLNEIISFCQANPSSTLREIRFVVYQQDQALVNAFGQEMANLQSKHKFPPAKERRSLFQRVLSSLKFGRGIPARPAAGRVRIEVLGGNLCHEQTDAIVNITSKDLNMDNAGALSKAVKQASGIQDELNRLGPQAGGSAVITSGGNLAARHIIHLIPDSSDKRHLQQCVEKCLRLAESIGIQSISLPAIGTGIYGMSATDSASLIFQAFSNFSANFNTIRKVRIVIFQPQMLQVFQQEHQRHLSLPNQTAQPFVTKTTGLSIEVINGDLTQETNDAIINIISTDMDMNKAGDLSKAILRAGGQQIQQELSQLGKQTAGTAVMTSGGNLRVRHIIHIIPGSSNMQDLQTSLEAGLRLADTHNLRSVSIPSVGTGGFGLAAADSAQITFQALNNFRGNCKSVRKVRVVVFQAPMMQAFLRAQQSQAGIQVVDDPGSDSSSASSSSLSSCSEETLGVQSRKSRSMLSVTNDPSVKIFLTGRDKTSVEKAVDSLKKGFSEACTTEKVENDTVSQLSHKQIGTLKKKAIDRDVRLELEAAVDCIVVRGDPTEVTAMVGEIWHELNARKNEIQEEQQVLLILKNIEWSYEIHGNKMAFDPKANAKIEMAHTKEQSTVQISLRGDEFVIDLKAETGRGGRSRETIKLSRKVKGAEEGIALPKHWAPMPLPDTTVHTVTLAPGSTEYLNVMQKVQATASGLNIQKIERVQNPHLYKSYMVRKQKMDNDNGGNNERELFHGTDAENVKSINTQGFKRSFCGKHGTACGRGVYFARDASYSVTYAGGGGGARYMYLARVLVGQYCQGNSSMIVPPPKNLARREILFDSVVDNPGTPSMFVVFYDAQCYPEYLITFV